MRVDTPARIITSLPKPDPVPASSFWSPLVLKMSFKGVAMMSMLGVSPHSRVADNVAVPKWCLL